MKELLINNIQSSTINVELWSEKGEVTGAVDDSVNVDEYELTFSNKGATAQIEIVVGNSGDENSILEYSSMFDNRPAGVYIHEGSGNLISSDTGTIKIDISSDYLEVGDTEFNFIVNSNSQIGSKSNTYHIIIHKTYSIVYPASYYDDQLTEQYKPVLQKPQLLTRYTYTGREYNRETGQYYYRARTYASGLGRFTGKDPWTWQPDDARIRGLNNHFIVLFSKNNLYLMSLSKYLLNTGSVLGLNETQYNYAKNNPMKFNDPYGFNGTETGSADTGKKPLSMGTKFQIVGGLYILGGILIQAVVVADPIPGDEIPGMLIGFGCQALGTCLIIIGIIMNN